MNEFSGLQLCILPDGHSEYKYQITATGDKRKRSLSEKYGPHPDATRRNDGISSGLKADRLETQEEP